MNVKRKSDLIKHIRKTLDENKLKRVQMLLRRVRGQNRMIIKFTDIDSEEARNSLKAIAGRYCEDLEYKDETKTTLSYFI